MNPRPSSSSARQDPPESLVREVAALFLRLGTTAFGGPVAHIAMMREEAVARRHWLTDAEFVDLLGATNLIPGPNSTQMAIQLGYRRAGWRGLIAGGVLFILPAFVIVLCFAWAYVQYGTRPAATWLFYGVKPVIIAVVLVALWSLSRVALRGPLAAAVGAAVFVLYLLGYNEIALLFGGGAVVMVVRNTRRLTFSHAALIGLIPAATFAPIVATAAASSSADVDLWTLFLSFLKIGAVLYGSGYVLLAFLRSEFVVRLGWLTDQQLLDAVAVGQVTPGPVFTTATFVGYVVAGFPGALLATVGIFLPSFIFVPLVYPLVPRLRGSVWMSSLLDGVNAAALGLMAAVCWSLGRDAIVDAWTAAIAVIAFAALLRWRTQSVWLILLGALAGVAHHFVFA